MIWKKSRRNDSALTGEREEVISMEGSVRAATAGSLKALSPSALS